MRAENVESLLGGLRASGGAHGVARPTLPEVWSRPRPLPIMKSELRDRNSDFSGFKPG